MKINKSFVKTIGGGLMFMLGFNILLDSVAEANRSVGYHFGKIDGFSEGCKYARRRGINENKDNNSNENKD